MLGHITAPKTEGRSTRIDVDEFSPLLRYSEKKSIWPNPPRYVSSPDWTQNIPARAINQMIEGFFEGRTIGLGGATITIPHGAGVLSQTFGLGIQDPLLQFAQNMMKFGITKTEHEYQISLGGRQISAHTLDSYAIPSLVQVGQEVRLGMTVDIVWVQNLNWSLPVVQRVLKEIREIWATFSQPVLSLPIGLNLPAGTSLLDQAVRLEGGAISTDGNGFEPVTVVFEAKIG